MSRVAQTLIYTLLPDDEDERMEVIADDYQHQSDIEMFEQFTGKVIQPDLDATVTGDEIELEEIEGPL